MLRHCRNNYSIVKKIYQSSKFVEKTACQIDINIYSCTWSPEYVVNIITQAVLMYW